jgi:hypothetical protein
VRERRRTINLHGRNCGQKFGRKFRQKNKGPAHAVAGKQQVLRFAQDDKIKTAAQCPPKV